MDERQRGQLFDLALVDRGLEGEVEAVQGALERQMGQAHAGAQVALTPGGGLHAEQVDQELGVGQLLLGGGFQTCFEQGGGLLQPELLELRAGLLQGDHGRAPTSAS